MNSTLKEKIIITLSAVAGVCLFGLTIVLLSVTERKGFDPKQCEISEISPDISIDVKEKCRILRANANKN